MDAVMGAETPEGAGSVDAFTGELWRSWKWIRERYGVEVRSFVLIRFAFVCRLVLK